MKVIYVVYSKKHDRLMSSPSIAFSSESGAKTAMTYQFSGRGNYTNIGTKDDYRIMKVGIK